MAPSLTLMRKQSPGRRRNQDTRAVNNTKRADLRGNLTVVKTSVLGEAGRGHASRSARPRMSLLPCLGLLPASSGGCQTENTRSWREVGPTSSRRLGASPEDPPASAHCLMASPELTSERAPSASSQWTAILARLWRGQTDIWGPCLGGQCQGRQITILPAPPILYSAAPVVTWPTSLLVSGLRPITPCPPWVTAATLLAPVPFLP